MGIEFRSIKDDEFPAWSDALDIGFYSPERRDGGTFMRNLWAEEIPAGRVFAAFDGDQLVGTLGAWQAQLTVPGGLLPRVAAITAVTVQPTHRRRGILTGMMATALRQAVELEEPASILIPAEYPIYGRFGYGLATEETAIEIDATEARLVHPLPGTISYLSAEQWCEQMPELYERIRVTSPGSINRREWWWRRNARLLRPESQDEEKARLFVVCRDEDGVARGYATYKIKNPEAWDGFRPKQTIEATVCAETPAARVRLMQFLWEHDWIAKVEIDLQPLDDSWRYLLANARVVSQQDRFDTVWVRPLDVPVLLSQRTYTNEDRLIFAVTDKYGHAEGTYALEGGPDGALCTRTTESPELTMPVQSLGSLYLGGFAATSLALIGQVTEERAGALGVADRMFKTAIPPFAQTWF